MKHSITTLVILLSALLATAQNSPIDFESAGYGASWTWTTFENDDNPALEIVANPDKAGANQSAMVAKFTARKAGQPWAGCESKHGADIGTFKLDANTSQVKIMVWKTVVSDVGIKLVDKSSASLGEIKVANTKTNEWEELTFDFKSREGIEYDQIVIFMDFKARSQDNVCYFDNVVFGAKAPLAAPMSPADAPTDHASNVISLFSHVYADKPVDSWRTGWSSAQLDEITINGDTIKRYSALDFVGIETVGANALDVSTMDHFNLQVWSPNSTVFKVKLVDFGADGQYQGGDDSEHEIEFTAPAKEQWIKYRIPLTDFTGLKARKNISQIIFVSAPSGSSVVYVDNVYFSKGSVTV